MVCIIILTCAIVITKVDYNIFWIFGLINSAESNYPIFFYPKRKSFICKKSPINEHFSQSLLFDQIYVFDPVPDANISTFRPLDQAVNSNIRYNGNGYLPCNGFVPCQVNTTSVPCRHFLTSFIIGENRCCNTNLLQPDQLSPAQLEERMEDAGPCHNYKGQGANPEGCW